MCSVKKLKNGQVDSKKCMQIKKQRVPRKWNTKLDKSEMWECYLKKKREYIPRKHTKMQINDGGPAIIIKKKIPRKIFEVQW